ncbi:MAG TPA: SprT family zinc-dependent metalloprotease [Patescibacteria group bacterium]|nr:SprT family zinc-dependent metalloprotease [Patescibacteria group bacterium]
MAVTPTIIRQNRASISIQITRSGEVVVKAPRFIPQFMIDQFISSRKEWIEKSLAKVSVRLPKKRTYTEGEEFLFLGIPHELKFSSGAEIVAKNGVLFFPKGAAFRIQKELEMFFKKQAEKIIRERVILHAKKMQTNFAAIFFSDTSSKWGTCFADNTLQFNWRLIMAPLLVIDYVVIHELTHTTEKHHQDSFWRRVRLFTPAYRQHRKWLTDNGHLLHF